MFWSFTRRACRLNTRSKSVAPSWYWVSASSTLRCDASTALDSDPENVSRAREHIRTQGVYGPISAQLWSGDALPYVDNLVNLLMVETPKNLTRKEMLRVVAPGGMLCLREGREWTTILKEVPEEIDEWSHFLHGPNNNPVAEDSRSGPPEGMQWQAHPQWPRHHSLDKQGDPAVRSVVFARGRVFYIYDAATAAHMKVPARWVLVARDAFSGVRLWERSLGTDPLPTTELGRLWRFMVTDGERVYTPKSAGKAVCAFDAITGEEVLAYPQTRNMYELIVEDGILYSNLKNESLVAVEASSGKELWNWKSPDNASIIPLTLAASAGRIFVRAGETVYALDGKEGKSLWTFGSESPPTGERSRTQVRRSSRRSKFAARDKLIVQDGVVLFSYGGNTRIGTGWFYMGKHLDADQYKGVLAAVSADDGKLLWNAEYKIGLARLPGDVFVMDGLVWIGPDYSKGYDLKTGEVCRTNPVLEDLWTMGHHHRCYPEKATSRYILNSMRGVEFMDTQGNNHTRCNWVRGTCRVGLTPCNGMMYATPHSCSCYMEAKLFGFWALNPHREALPGAEPTQRLEKGPAYDQKISKAVADSDWPVYRHDGGRGGVASTSVPRSLSKKWTVDLGGRLSAPVVANGRLIASQIDAHQIHCFDADNGEKIWSFTVGGRVDSPPSIHDGKVLAGCADGYVYCLRLSDGALVWRFFAAQRRANGIVFDQVESLWPVHGSILVKNGLAYATAGRSSYLDGGIVIYALDVNTGEERSRELINSQQAKVIPRPPDDKKIESKTIFQNAVDYKTLLAPDKSDAFSMAGAMSDVLVADNESIFLRNIRLDDELKTVEEKRPHLFSTTRLLDGGEIHRSHWFFGTGDFSRTGVAYPWIANQGSGGYRSWQMATVRSLMMVFDDKHIWGVARTHLKSKQSGEQLYAIFNHDRPPMEFDKPDFHEDKSGFTVNWEIHLPLRPRALVRGGDYLFVGGMSDSFTEEDALAPENATFEGRGEGVLYVCSAADGSQEIAYKLDSPTIWDGIAAANHDLYLSLNDGNIVCLSGGE